MIGIHLLSASKLAATMRNLSLTYHATNLMLQACYRKAQWVKHRTVRSLIVTDINSVLLNILALNKFLEGH